MAGGGFGLAITSELLVSVTSMCSARAKGDPPQPHQAPRRARRSPFCARGEAKVSCGPRGGVGGGIRKTGGCTIGKGLGSASGLGVGTGLRWQDFLEGFHSGRGEGGGVQAAHQRWLLARSTLSATQRRALTNPLCRAPAPTSTGAKAGRCRRRTTDDARERGSSAHSSCPSRSAPAAPHISADSFAAKNRGHCRRSGEQLLAVACGAAFGVQHRFSRVLYNPYYY